LSTSQLTIPEEGGRRAGQKEAISTPHPVEGQRDHNEDFIMLTYFLQEPLIVYVGRVTRDIRNLFTDGKKRFLCMPLAQMHLSE
jgi:hypothetical protein